MKDLHERSTTPSHVPDALILGVQEVLRDYRLPVGYRSRYEIPVDGGELIPLGVALLVGVLRQT